jgi:hypothetical protein
MPKASVNGKDPFGREFRIKNDLRQRHVAEWNAAYIRMSRVGIAEQLQAALQAAIVAGWIETPETRVVKEVDLASGDELVRYSFDGVDIGELKAAEVFYYGRLCDERYTAEVEIPNG